MHETEALRATELTIAGRTVTLVCHMAVLSGRQRRNSFAAIEECLAAGAARIELDVHTLDGGDAIIFHERKLEHETTGTGSIGSVTADDVRKTRWLDHASDRPPLLSEVVEMARGRETEVQLDLKDWRPMSDERVRALLDPIAPVHDRVIVSCGQDWNLRRLHEADPSLAIGFDPGHYIDRASEGSPFFLPRTMGAYGYRDDHPLAIGRTQTVTDYLDERLRILRGHVPGVREFFLSYRMVLQMLDDGFNAMRRLHERDIGVTVWTPDYKGAASMRAIERLVEAGVDRITTNTIPAWREAAAAAVA